MSVLVQKTFSTTCNGDLFDAINDNVIIVTELEQIIYGGGATTDFYFASSLSGAEDTELDSVLASWVCPDPAEETSDSAVVDDNSAPDPDVLWSSEKTENTFVPLTRTVDGTLSITGGGDLTTDRTLSLVNDAASPGNTKLYGTNASGVKGWYDTTGGGGAFNTEFHAPAGTNNVNFTVVDTWTDVPNSSFTITTDETAPIWAIAKFNAVEPSNQSKTFSHRVVIDGDGDTGVIDKYENKYYNKNTHFRSGNKAANTYTVKLQIMDTVGTSNVDVSNLTIFAMSLVSPPGPQGATGATGADGADGADGEDGAPGAGSTVLVKEEGTNITNTPHSAFNFIGTGVTATDAGGGVADITITTSGIIDVVDDTTPQLGGDLDVNGQDIVSVSNGDINITPNGTGRAVVTNLEAPMLENAQTGTAYVPVISDAEIMITMDNAASNIVTIPANASVAYPVGTKLNFSQIGAGQTTIAITTDTLNVESSLSLKLTGQYAVATAWKRTSTTWILFGNLELS